GQWDEDAVLRAIGEKPDYLGVVASSKRFAEMREVLSRTAGAAALSSVKNPAGLDLGATLPEEVALSVLAEIVKEARSKPASLPGLPTAKVEEALDPVCGMSVRVSASALTAEHGGRVYYFCCSGCREKFRARPEAFLAVASRP